MTRRPQSSDASQLRTLLGLHVIPRPRILDASYSHGVIWRGTPYRPIRLDARAELDVDVVGDWNNLGELFPAASFDVVVWDPPHVTDAGCGIVGSVSWADRYGTHSDGLRADNISHLFAPFLRAARTVLVPSTGIVLAKIADQVHSGAQQLQFVDFVNAARAEGFTVCDYSVKTRAAGIEDPKWTHRHHVRKPWSFWVVARAGDSCKGPGASLLRICPSCDLPFKAARSDAVTCSTRCRQRRRRRTASTSKSDLAHISHVTSFTVRGLTEV